MQWSNDSTTIRRLRVRTDSPDPQAARQHTARALNAAELSPRGLAPSAILCVRRLNDPRPGRVGLRPSAPRPDPEWEQAVRSALERLAREAARPAQGFVPPSAEAVLFADRAELLACLAADWLDGTLAGRWWWQGLLGGSGSDRALLEAWLSAPEFLPAALERLARAGLAALFARRLEERPARRLVETLAAFHVPALAPLLNAVLAAEAAGPPEMGPAGRPGAPGRVSPGADDLPRKAGLIEGESPPWMAWAPEAGGAELAAPQRLLLGIGLGLARAPQVLRGSAFAGQLRAWLERRAAVWARGAEPPAAALPASPEPGPGALPASARPEPAAGVSAPNAGEGKHDQLAAGELRRVRPSAAAQAGQEPPASAGSGLEPASPLGQESLPLESGQGIVPPAGLERQKAAAEVAPPAWPWKAAEPLPLLLAERVESDFAGVFYLINLGIALGLYGDFTTPASPGIDLPVWDFIALLARGLLGASFEADPLWNLLARLAGRRPEQPPGRGFRPPDAWRMPPEWLAAFPETGEWRWSARGRRLRVAHPAGFLVLDIPLPLDAHPAQGTKLRGLVRSLLQPYAGAGQLRRAQIRAPGGRKALERWLARLLPYVSARLVRALPGTATGAQAARLAFQQPGLVSAAPARLDVLFSLARLPVEVRLSGLDIDPGWVPAAGRTIAFHYE